LTKKKKMLSDISGSQSGENEDDTFLGKHHWNVSQLLRDYTAQ
jgi:hypothetical protein